MPIAQNNVTIRHVSAPRPSSGTEKDGRSVNLLEFRELNNYLPFRSFTDLAAETGLSIQFVCDVGILCILISNLDIPKNCKIGNWIDVYDGEWGKIVTLRVFTLGNISETNDMFFTSKALSGNIQTVKRKNKILYSPEYALIYLSSFLFSFFVRLSQWKCSED